MPIYSDDIKTRQAAVAGQFADSGGRIHPTEYVVHHEVGNLLPKLTEVDHAGGRVDLSKAYLSIETTGTEAAEDAYTYIDASPADPLVDVLLFQPTVRGLRAAHTDERADAQGYIEAYQVAGGRAPWYLRGRHVAGMRTIQLWSRPEPRLPEVGQTLYLVEDEGGGGEHGQYVTILDFQYATEQFSEPGGGGSLNLFDRRIVTATLTQALGAEFEGPEVSYADPSVEDLEGATAVRECVVADGSRYYGRSALTAAAQIDDLTVAVDSVYGYVVPSARGEAPLASVAALSAGAQTVTSGGEAFTVSGPVHTQREEVTTGTRRLIWTRTLLPIPAASGLVHVHARILDRWYTLVEGESNPVGTLVCNRLNGSTTCTLSALPDADTWMIWEWPSAIHFTDRAGTALVSPVTIPFALPSLPEIATLVLTWTSGGNTKTATEQSDGTLTGHATGYRVGLEGVLYLTANLPDGGTTIGYEYDPLVTVTEVLEPTMDGNNAEVTLSDPPRAGSVRISWTVMQNHAVNGAQQMSTDDDFWPYDVANVIYR